MRKELKLTALAVLSVVSITVLLQLLFNYLRTSTVTLTPTVQGMSGDWDLFVILIINITVIIFFIAARTSTWTGKDNKDG